MTKHDFINSLNQYLSVLSNDERDSVLRYYEELIEDAGKDNEADFINGLGSPESVADEIVANMGIIQIIPDKKASYSNKEQAHTTQKYRTVNWTTVIILVVTSPLWGGLLMGIGGAVLGIAVAVACVVICLPIISIALFVGALISFFTNLPLGLLYFGLSLTFCGISIIITVPIIKLIFKALRSCLIGFINITRSVVFKEVIIN